MDFLERDLEDIIHGAEQKAIRSRGLWTYDYDKVYRQVQLLEYGKADLITIKTRSADMEDAYFRRVIQITVYELKQQKVDANALMQAARYQTAVAKIVDQAKSEHDLSRTDFKLSVVLIGRAVEISGNFCFLIDLFTESLKVFTYSYGVDGIRFSQSSGWEKTGCDLTDRGGEFIADYRELLSTERFNATARRQHIVDLNPGAGDCGF